MRQQGKVRIAWLLWLAVTLITGGTLAASLFMTERVAETPMLAQVRAQFLPGQTSVGHYQVELACESCHTRPFSDAQTIQDACVGCHGAALKEGDDKHPLSKFTDPRNAELLERIDARLCVTCHVEHRPEITQIMGVTQPADFCFRCHESIAEDRPSHAGMGFDSCAASGCHNFHDNRALYEDFLLKHANAPAHSPVQQLSMTNLLEVAALLPGYPVDRFPLEALARAQADAPTGTMADDAAVDDWLASTHATAGVNCSGCHGEVQSGAWVAQPAPSVCAGCHAQEQRTFLEGRHGMRLAQGLSPMTPSMARLPMKDGAAHVGLVCTTCHGAHRFDVRRAAVEACLGCHDDEHSLAYPQSPHAALWQRELKGDAEPGSGVTCATCHMPRIEHRHETYDLKQIFVQHNQSDTLRPNEKMLRPVCMSCHGLPFAIDALADPQAIRTNFRVAPAGHVSSVDMAMARDE